MDLRGLSKKEQECAKNYISTLKVMEHGGIWFIIAKIHLMNLKIALFISIILSFFCDYVADGRE
jgi:hypothetical protein